MEGKRTLRRLWRGDRLLRGDRSLRVSICSMALMLRDLHERTLNLGMGLENWDGVVYGPEYE